MSPSTPFVDCLLTLLVLIAAIICSREIVRREADGLALAKRVEMQLQVAKAHLGGRRVTWRRLRNFWSR